VTITDAGGMTVTSTATVTVAQTLASITDSPQSTVVAAGGTQQFAATALDQFGNPMASQPSFTWTSATGTITNGGFYQAPNVSTSDTVEAAAGNVSQTATVIITQGPSVATPASATPNPVTGTTAALSVVGADDAGEANLTYAWSVTTLPTGAVAPTFSASGTSAAENTTATFFGTGSYAFTVTITDAVGLTATSSVTVTVDQTFMSLAVSPPSASLLAGGTQQFAATALDQFGNPMASQPSFTWGATTGSITGGGFYTAPAVSAVATIRAAADSIVGTATVAVTDLPPSVATAAAASPNPVTGTTTVLSVLGADDAGESNLTYTWAVTSVPAGARGTLAPTFSVNGTNASKDTTATFFLAGPYTFTVTITDAGGLTTTSTARVTVLQTLTSISVVPLSQGLGASGTRPFGATAADQFGDAFAVQPPFSWSVVGIGTIDHNGKYAPPYAAGSATVVAESGSVTGTYTVTFPGAAQWSSTSSGTWDSTANWTVSGQTMAVPGLRGVVGDTVAFDTPSPATVTLDGAKPSLAQIAFNGSAGVQIVQGTGGALQLGASSNNAVISVVAGKNTISVPVLLTSNLVVSPAAASQLTISGGISGTGQSLSVDGPGMVVVSGANSYSGGTIVSAGTLIATSSSAIAANTSLTVGAAGVFIFDPSVGVPPSAVAKAAHPPIASPIATTAKSNNRVVAATDVKYANLDHSTA